MGHVASLPLIGELGPVNRLAARAVPVREVASLAPAREIYKDSEGLRLVVEKVIRIVSVQG